jgi:hypothetical protein
MRMKGTPMQKRRSVCTPHRMRHASPSDAGFSSVWTVSSSAPMRARSWRPRVGSFSRKAKLTRMNVGMAAMMKAQRQPSR